MPGFGCHCLERAKPVAERNWIVTQRHVSYSAFNGYHAKYSDWSTVRCLSCGGHGRTKAKFVDKVRDGVWRDGNWH